MPLITQTTLLILLINLIRAQAMLPPPMSRVSCASFTDKEHILGHDRTPDSNETIYLAARPIKLIGNLKAVEIAQGALMLVSKGRKCSVCGDCFKQLYASITDLKTGSINLVEKSYTISDSLISGQIFENPPFSTDPAGGKNLINEFDTNISKIGEIILTNKHQSDQLNLLSGGLQYLTGKITHFKMNIKPENLFSWYKDLIRQLQFYVGETICLRSILERQAHILTKQYKVLHLLHEETDQLILDINKKLEHSSCNSSSTD